ncbi:MAG: trypsin-like peptidase domain-containing protein [Dehalococcoidia bacterium]
MTSDHLHDFSDALADAVARAAEVTVTVAARRRFAASGIAWGDRLVVTADHVIEDEEHIRVTLANGEQATADLVGRDPGSDLAVLRLPVDAPAPTLAPEGGARVGHVALALGRPGAQVQASLGVVSALGGPRRTRTGTLIEGTLRTDATFLPGFSGGPLIDTQGRVIGLNTSGFRTGNVTIAASAVTAIAQQLAEHGRVRRAYLGVGSQPVHLPEAAGQEVGLLIVSVEAGTPAAQAGIVVGDVLLGIEGTPITGAEELQAALGSDRVGATVRLSLLRGGAPHEVRATLGERQR